MSNGNVPPTAADRPPRGGVSSPAELTAAITTGAVETAVAALRAVITYEDSLAANNRLAPYADRLPPALADAPGARVARALALMSGPEMRRILFGSFRQLPPRVTQEVVDSLAAEPLARLLTALAWGHDGPLQAACLLAAAPVPPTAALRLLEPVLAARLLGVLPEGAAEVVRAAESGGAGPWWAAVRAAAVPAELVVLDSACTGEEVPPARAVPDPRDVASAAAAHGRAPDLRTFREGSLVWQRDVLGALPARLAGELLAALMPGSADLAALLLGAIAEFVLVPEDGRARRVSRALRAVAVLAAVPEPARTSLAAAVDPRVAEVVVSPVLRRAYQASGYPRTRARGRRRQGPQVAPGVDWVHLEEKVWTDTGSHPLRVDLLELDLAQVRVAVRCASPASRIPLPEVAALVGQADRASARPPEALFRELGLARLSEEVRRERAVAGLNGGFYFDYGHYLDALDLGIDLSQEVGLAYGDVIDWFVQDGVELSPPLFGRAALAVTEDGAVHLRRTRVTAAEVGPVRLHWDSVNRPGPATVRYDRLFGPRTPEDPDKVDVVVAAGTVLEVRPGGGARIPLLGFVVSLPAARFHGSPVRPGSVAVVRNDFPRALGHVEQAMACGPMLVRDGQVDLDVAAESFGDKDSSVLPLSLTRASDSFRAARSFLVLRAGTLAFGTVSGTMLGGGPPSVSMGVTFGELAQLCVDLGAEDAMALDGGGSSTLVAATPEPGVLNVPTGGSDVPVGSERFLKTYLLALRRTP